MYDEEHTFFRRLNNISGYTRGYLEGSISAQKQVWGYNFIRELMQEDIMDDMSKDLPMQASKDSVVSREYLFAEYCINREITARERMEYIDEVGRIFSGSGKRADIISEDKSKRLSEITMEEPGIDLYTGNRDLEIAGVFNHGPIDHYATAPFVYDRAKINLNITLRSIHTGIPLRAFEILGSGGFLLSNYQADFADCYVDGEDYVSFGSKEDMLNKIEYYLSHEKERQEIAANGLRRTMENHTYEHRIKEMLAFL
jgi:spore maturation protein CgeB